MQLWQRRAVGLLGVGGGCIGVAAVLTALLQQRNPLEWAFSVAFMALYAWGVWCGLRLLESQPGAERSNLKFWLAQVPVVASPVFGYFLSSGFHLTVSLQPEGWNFKANTLLGSMFNYSFMQAGTPVVLGVNVFALVIALWLLRQLRRLPPNNSSKPTPLRGAA